jgi:hypothetical protein
MAKLHGPTFPASRGDIAKILTYPSLTMAGGAPKYLRGGSYEEARIGMQRLDSGQRTSAPYHSRSSALRGLAAIGGALAWVGAAAVGAVMALFFAATVVVIGLMASALIALAAAAVKARRSLRRAQGPDVIEARHVGGHSWVAYGWDGRS